jgi:hypothetical protein
MRKLTGLVLAAGALVAVLGCGAAMAAIAPIAMEFASKLLKTGEGNFGSDYADQLAQLLRAYATPARAQAPESAAKAEPLTLDADILRVVAADGGRTTLAAVEDGAVLRDAASDPAGKGDRLRVTFRANQRCWVYVLAIDATAWAVPLFPNPNATGAVNPVLAGKAYVSPDGDVWLELDEFRGVEHVYFLASRVQRPDIEEQFARLAAQERPPGALAPVEDRAVTSRGVRLTSKRTAIKTPQGALEATSFLGEAGSGDLLVTRWFVHE